MFGGDDAKPPFVPEPYVPNAALVFKEPAAVDGSLLFGYENEEEDEEKPGVPYEPSGALLFDHPAVTTGELVFELEPAPEGSEGANIPVAVSLSLPGPTVEVRIALSVPVTADFVLPGPSVDVHAVYVSGAARPLVARALARYQDADPQYERFAAMWQDSTHFQVGAEVVFEKADPLPTAAELGWQDAIRIGREGVDVRYQDGDRLHVDAKYSFQDAIRVGREGLLSRYQVGLQHRLATQFRYQDGLRNRGEQYAVDYQEAKHLPGINVLSRSSHGALMELGWSTRYQEGKQPDPGMYVRPPKPVDPEPTCYVPSPALLFEYPWDGSAALLFICDHDGAVDPGEPGETVVIPVKRVYILDNEVSLTRADNGTVIKALSIGLSLDVGSWTWSFNAAIPPYYLDDLQRSSPGVPVELLAKINGQTVRVIVEDMNRERTWESKVLRVTGRGVSALLSSPFAPVLNFGSDIDMTMEQLANDVLTDNGAPIGWDVDWKLEDWLVPGGVFRADGTYMDALNQIATAAGGYVQPHMTQRTLKFLKKYPTLPWNWASATPDFELPADAVTVEGIQWTTKPVYNRVFVSGMQGGVAVDAARAGTDGLSVAPGIVDPLITDVIGGRARAEPVFADGGEQTLVRVRTPVFPASGLIVPGKLVRYVDEGVVRIGLSRALSVEASQEESWQTIEVETHA